MNVIMHVPFNGFDEIGSGGLSHALKEVVPRQRRRRRAEHVGVLHSSFAGKWIRSTDGDFEDDEGGERK